MTRIKFEDLPSKKTPINAANLNKLNNLAIDKTIDNHDEEVILLDSKNKMGYAKFVDTLFCFANGDLGYSKNGGENTYLIPIKSNTAYTISRTTAGTRFRVATYTTYNITQDQTTPTQKGTNDTGRVITLTSGADDKYLFVNAEGKIKDILQVEEGNTETTFEEPTPSSIYANGEKYSDTVNIGPEPNNSGLHVEKNERQLLSNIINTQTKNGITLTSKGDGRYILNGTATAGTDFQLEKYNFISGKKYFLTGGYNTNSFLYIQNNGSDNGSGLSYNPTSDSSLFVGLYINSGITLSNVEIKPMLEHGTSSKGFEPIITPSIKINNNGVYETIVDNGTILWQNPNSNANFGGQTITLNDNLQNYKKWEIIYYYDIGSAIQLSTGRIYTDKVPILNFISSSSGAVAGNRRLINSASNNKVEFSNNSLITNATATNNTFNIPYQIIGYK